MLADMREAGLAPGPRAWHVLALAHLKAGDVDGALDASVRADAGGGRVPGSRRAGRLGRVEMFLCVSAGWGAVAAAGWARAVAPLRSWTQAGSRCAPLRQLAS